MKLHLQSLQPVLPEVDSNLPLEMETSRQNANRSSKNTLRLKTGAWRDSDTVFTARAESDTHAGCCFPFWRPCSQCLQTDSIWAWWFPPHQPPQDLQREELMAKTSLHSQGLDSTVHIRPTNAIQSMLSALEGKAWQ